MAETVVAMGVTQSFRSDGTVISAVGSHWKSPKQRQLAFDQIPPQNRLCPGFDRSAAIPVSFFLNRDDTVDLAIVGPQGRVRRALAVELVLEGDRRHCVLWDERDDAGALVPSARYRLRVTLDHADRVALAGETFRAPRQDPPGTETATP